MRSLAWKRKFPSLSMRESGSRDVRKIADFIYERVLLHYTTKQWGITPKELAPSVLARVPVHLSRDERYFQDSFQFMPARGYAALFGQMLDHPLIEARTGTRFEDLESTERFDRVVFTGPIDEFCQHRHGPLPYRSVRFDYLHGRAMSSQTAPAENSTPEPPTLARLHGFRSNGPRRYRIDDARSGTQSRSANSTSLTTRS